MSLVTESRNKTLSIVKRTELTVRAASSSGNSLFAPSSGGSGASFGDHRRESQQAEFFGHFRGWVRACVDLIAVKVASQPILAGEVKGATANPERSYHGSKSKRFEDFRDVYQVKGGLATSSIVNRVKASDGSIDVLPDHEILDHLGQPNPVQGQFEFLYMWVANLLITGEGYIIYTESGTPGSENYKQESYAVPTNWLTPIHDGQLFSGYKSERIKGSDGNAKIFNPEEVARWYLPDPADIKNALSPLMAILGAVRSDDKIQKSQEEMFDSIYPKIAVTIGQNIGPDGKPTGRRARLSGAQRRQLLGALGDVLRGSGGNNDPIILDGLIDKFEYLTRSPREMDWEKSGDIVKKRIMQTYKVSPSNLGEMEASSRAAAFVSEKTLCDNALNPLINTASNVLTNFYGPRWEKPERLLVWIEPCVPVDVELKDKRWNEARKREDVSKNEWREEIGGLPPVEESDLPSNPLLTTVGGMTGTIGIMSAMGQGMMTPDSAKALLQLFLQIPEDRANDIVGDGPPPLPTTEPANLPEEAPSTPPNELNAERLALIAGTLRGLLDGQNEAHRKSAQEQTKYLVDTRKRVDGFQDSLAAQLAELRSLTVASFHDASSGTRLKQAISELEGQSRDLAGEIVGGLVKATENLQPIITIENKQPINVAAPAISMPQIVIEPIAIPAPIVNVNVQPSEVIVENHMPTLQPEIKFEPTINVSPTPINVESPTVEVQVNPTPVNIENNLSVETPNVQVDVHRDAPTSAEIRHPDGTVSRVDLKGKQ